MGWPPGCLGGRHRGREGAQIDGREPDHRDHRRDQTQTGERIVGERSRHGSSDRRGPSGGSGEVHEPEDSVRGAGIVSEQRRNGRQACQPRGEHQRRREQQQVGVADRGGRLQAQVAEHLAVLSQCSHPGRSKDVTSYTSPPYFGLRVRHTPVGLRSLQAGAGAETPNLPGTGGALGSSPYGERRSWLRMPGSPERTSRPRGGPRRLLAADRWARLIAVGRPPHASPQGSGRARARARAGRAGPARDPGLVSAAIVATDRRAFVFKTGARAGLPFSARLKEFEYESVMRVDLRAAGEVDVVVIHAPLKISTLLQLLGRSTRRSLEGPQRDRRHARIGAGRRCGRGVVAAAGRFQRPRSISPREARTGARALGRADTRRRRAHRRAGSGPGVHSLWERARLGVAVLPPLRRTGQGGTSAQDVQADRAAPQRRRRQPGRSS